MSAALRPIRPEDDAAMQSIIIQVMTEFGAVGEGYSIEDPEVMAMSAAYDAPRSAYFVVEHAGQVIGGAGYAPLAGAAPHICELRKMYVLKSARGLGAGRLLLDTCLSAAREHDFEQCYLETLEHMTEARRLYQRAGFRKLDSNLGHTGHFGCNSWMLLNL